jgi:heme/copper-type cytochrome/quinol oxidase subunit 2
VGDAPVGKPSDSQQREWRSRLRTWAIVVIVLIVVGFLGAAFIPRWWSHRIADQANGSFTGGILLGIFYGFVFTVLPLLLIVWAIRRRHSLRAWGVILAIAILFALPNLFALGIVFGSGGASHAGERTLDVEAPGFRNSSLGGAIVAVVAVVFVWYLMRSRRRAREREANLRAELRALEQQAAEATKEP